MPAYEVQPGDNLWDIAAKTTGDPNRWREIYDQNASVIGGDPGLIQPGQVLAIPYDQPANNFASDPGQQTNRAPRNAPSFGPTMSPQGASGPTRAGAPAVSPQAPPLAGAGTVPPAPQYQGGRLAAVGAQHMNEGFAAPPFPQSGGPGYAAPNAMPQQGARGGLIGAPMTQRPQSQVNPATTQNKLSIMAQRQQGAYDSPYLSSQGSFGAPSAGGVQPPVVNKKLLIQQERNRQQAAAQANGASQGLIGPGVQLPYRSGSMTGAAPDVTYPQVNTRKQEPIYEIPGAKVYQPGVTVTPPQPPATVTWPAPPMVPQVPQGPRPGAQPGLVRQNQQYIPTQGQYAGGPQQPPSIPVQVPPYAGPDMAPQQPAPRQVIVINADGSTMTWDASTRQWVTTAAPQR